MYNGVYDRLSEPLHNKTVTQTTEGLGYPTKTTLRPEKGKGALHNGCSECSRDFPPVSRRDQPDDQRPY